MPLSQLRIAIEGRRWLVVKVPTDGGVVVIGSNQLAYSTEAEADKEMESLVKADPKHFFMKLQIKGGAKAAEIEFF